MSASMVRGSSGVTGRGITALVVSVLLLVPLGFTGGQHRAQAQTPELLGVFPHGSQFGLFFFDGNPLQQVRLCFGYDLDQSLPDSGLSGSHICQDLVDGQTGNFDFNATNVADWSAFVSRLTDSTDEDLWETHIGIYQDGFGPCCGGVADNEGDLPLFAGGSGHEDLEGAQIEFIRLALPTFDIGDPVSGQHMVNAPGKQWEIWGHADGGGDLQPPVAAFSTRCLPEPRVEGDVTVELPERRNNVLCIFRSLSEDPDGQFGNLRDLAHEWRVNGQLQGTRAILLMRLGEGEHRIFLTVRDADGIERSVEWVVTVVRPGEPPPTEPPLPTIRTAPYDFVTALNGLVQCNVESTVGTATVRTLSFAQNGQIVLWTRARSVSGNANGRAGVGVTYEVPVSGRIRVTTTAIIRGQDVLTLVSLPRLGDIGVASVQSFVETQVKRLRPGAPAFDVVGVGQFANRSLVPGPFPFPSESHVYEGDLFSGSIELDVMAGDTVYVCGGVRARSVAAGLVGGVAFASTTYGELGGLRFGGPTEITKIVIEFVNG